VNQPINIPKAIAIGVGGRLLTARLETGGEQRVGSRSDMLVGACGSTTLIVVWYIGETFGASYRPE
jgi:hypothetical protein